MNFILLLALGFVFSCAKVSKTNKRDIDAAEVRLEAPPPNTFVVEYFCPEKTFYHKDFLYRRGGNKKCHTTRITLPSGKVRVFNNNFEESYSTYHFTRFRKATARYLIVDTAYYEGGTSTMINMMSPNSEENDELLITAGGEPTTSPDKKYILINGHLDDSGYTEQHYDIVTFDSKNKLAHLLAISENPDFIANCRKDKKIGQCLFYPALSDHLDKFEWISEDSIEGQACKLTENGLNYNKCQKLKIELKNGQWIPSWETP